MKHSGLQCVLCGGSFFTGKSCNSIVIAVNSEPRFHELANNCIGMLDEVVESIKYSVVELPGQFYRARQSEDASSDA